MVGRPMIAAVVGKLVGWKGYVVAGAVGAVLVAGASLAWQRHGINQWDAGYEAREAEARLELAALESAKQKEVDRADGKYRDAIVAREVAARDLIVVRGRLDGLLRANGRDPENPRASRRSDEAGPDWIAGFAECYSAYGDLATSAAGWADQVNGLQGYVRAIRLHQAIDQ